MNQTHKFESVAYYILLAVTFLTPLAFWPSTFISSDAVKTFIIVVGTMVAAVLLAIVIYSEKRLVLPPKNILWTSILLAASFIISSLISINASKSLFGQGFEMGTAGLILALFVCALAVIAVVMRKPERALVFYADIIASFAILYLFQAARLLLGPDFASLGILTSTTSSVLGGWLNMGILATTAALISLMALEILPLPRKLKISYWIFTVLAAFAALIINPPVVWQAAILVLAGLAIFASIAKPKVAPGLSGFLKRIAWLPVAAFLLSLVIYITSSSISGPLAVKIYGGYSELSLPWQMTLDVTSNAIKNYPVFGIGPNHFSQAYLAFKPDYANQGDLWSVEFGSGFGLIPTFVATQGITGTILWIIFFVFWGICGAKALKRLPEEKTLKFLIASSYLSATFLWLIAIFYVPSMAILLLTFILAAIFVATAMAVNALKPVVIEKNRPGWSKLFTVIVGLAAIVFILWGLNYAKKTLALAYFGSGVKELNQAGNANKADGDFSKALSFDKSDVYFQARAEAMLAKANAVVSAVPANAAASTTQAAASTTGALINQAYGYAAQAVAYDPYNYFNYLSEARVSEAANSMRMQNAYDNAVSAYSRAISLNPSNPSIYLSLARLQAGANKLDGALETVGAALRVKSNYLDGIFLLSQIEAAKGNLPDAITAAQVAIQIDPSNPLLYFQLGLLQYNNKDYEAASTSLSKATELSPNYANAQYFLGLSYARLGQTADAIAQFSALAKNNPDNQEIAAILSTLKEGKPIFADAPKTVVPNPSKRPNLPVKEKNTQ